MFGASQKSKKEYESTNIALVNWKIVKEKKCIHFTFKGIFTEQLAKELVAEWSKMMEEHPDEKVCIICECSAMQNYDSLARIQFQNCLKEYQKRISNFWIVTESKVAKYGGMIMGALLSFPIKVVESEDKISA